jgi:transketolase
LTTADQAGLVRRGGYVLSEVAQPRAVIVGTGSETTLAMEAQRLLADEGIPVRVVSMPCTHVFDRQPQVYRDGVLPLGLPAVAVEAAHTDFWYKYVGRTGAVVGMTTFGESAPAPVLYEHFQITARAVVERVKGLLP